MCYIERFFYRTLAPKLFKLPEKLIAHRLTELLLSRFVFLDTSANKFFLPHFLRPCRGKLLFSKEHYHSRSDLKR